MSLENWRPDVKQRLGLDYESLQAINPRIVLASISGYGQDGPYVDRPAFDQIVQGMGGLMSVTGFKESGPVRAGLAVADSSAGLYAALGIMTALLEREVSGLGQWVQTSLLHSQIAMMDFQAARYLVEGDVPVQEGNDHPTAAPMGLYHAADGALNLGVAGEAQWQKFCIAVGHAEWAERSQFRRNADRVRHREELSRLVQGVFATNTVAHWVDLLNRADIPAGPVYSVMEMFEDEQVKHCGVVTSTTGVDGRQLQLISQPVRLERTPSSVVAPAPDIGQHSEEVLREAGHAAADIARLRDLQVL